MGVENAAGGTAVPSGEEVQAELAKLVADPVFAGSPSVCRFLTFVVEGTLEGRGGQLKEYVIGVEALGRGTGFDPRLDPIVRVQARKLRAKLKSYYETTGAGNPVRIELALGGYAPIFRYAPPEEPLPAQAEPEAPPEAAKRRNLASRLGRKWMVVGATGILALGIGWLAPTAITEGAATGSAHIDIAVAPSATARLDANLVKICMLLGHELDDVIEDAGGLRSQAPQEPEHAALLRMHPRLPPGVTLRGLVDAAGNRVSVKATLESKQGRLLWSGIYDRDKSEIAALSHDIARDLLAGLTN